MKTGANLERLQRSPDEARARVERNKDDIASLLDHIGDVMKSFGDGEQIHWGHAGTLDHFRLLLVQATAFITGLKESEVLEALEDMRDGQ